MLLIPANPIERWALLEAYDKTPATDPDIHNAIEAVNLISETLTLSDYRTIRDALVASGNPAGLDLATVEDLLRDLLMDEENAR